jgi:hypothetical protein
MLLISLNCIQVTFILKALETMCVLMDTCCNSDHWNVMFEWLELCFMFGSSWIEVLAWMLCSLADDCDFPELFKENADIAP